MREPPNEEEYPDPCAVTQRITGERVAIIVFTRGDFMRMLSLAARTSARATAPSPPVERWEDGLRTGGAPGTLEFWSFDTVMDDGSTAGFNFFTRPPTELAGPLKPRVSINIARPDQRRTREVIDYHADEFSASRDHCD